MLRIAARAARVALDIGDSNGGPASAASLGPPLIVPDVPRYALCREPALLTTKHSTPNR